MEYDGRILLSCYLSIYDGGRSPFSRRWDLRGLFSVDRSHGFGVR